MTDVIVRPARVSDAKPIMTLVNELAIRQVMLPRSPASVIENIRDFLIAEVDGTMAGCGALAVTWTDLGEIRSLAVPPTSKSTGSDAPWSMRWSPTRSTSNCRDCSLSLTYQISFPKLGLRCASMRTSPTRSSTTARTAPSS